MFAGLMCRFMLFLTLLALIQIHCITAMQTHAWSKKSLHAPSAKQKTSSPKSSSETCAVLTNHEDVYATVQVAVGTPPQTFDIVADTGSNNVIIPSCICEANHRCHNNGVCFDGNKSSSTFAPTLDKVSNATAEVVLSFGSGDIATQISTDIVRVGKEEANMTDGLLLMVDNNLDFDIQGILGLGPPMKRTSDLYDITDRSWLRFAGISHFSLCFNEGDDGVMRLETHQAQKSFPSVGIEHWGVDFRGVSVGNKSVPAQFCNTSTMREDQETPCAAIPDSGTTMIVGPAQSLVSLFESICDSWQRCSELAAKNPDTPKFGVLQQVLYSCQDWLDESDGLTELPDLFFHIGSHTSLRLPPTGYILRISPLDLQLMNKRVGAEFINTDSVKPKTSDDDLEVCIPAFSQMEYETELNGPIFIFGSAFFYKWRVGYDMHAQTISFKREPCGSCDEKTKLASSTVSSGFRAGRRNNWPRKVRGERLPLIDVKKPL